MKTVTKCGVVVLTILLISQMCLAVQGNKAKRERPAKAASQEQKALQEKLKGLTPYEKMVARAKMDYEADMAPWRAVLKMATSEKATKTVELVKQTIAAKETEFKKKMTALEKRKDSIEAAPQTPGEGKNAGQKKERANKKNKVTE